ncbi:MarR family winged helix-turn-helix transcriptional regulator [Shewanella sp. 125m-7]
MTKDQAQELLSLDKQICFSLYSVTNAMVRAYRPLLEGLKLTYPQYLAMLVLWQQDGLSVKQLGTALHLDSGTLTPLLKRLEAKGLVTRGRSEQDERVRVLHTTVLGKELKSQAAGVPEKLRCQLQVSNEKLMQLKLLCDELYADLGQ